MKQETIIKIDDVWKKYDMGKADPLVVLKEINLEIKKGEFVAITGPSGSGKSTMMNIVGALDVPSWGEVNLKGKNISEMDESSLAYLRGKTIGFIFQQFNLLSTLSALQNVMLPMEISNISETEARVKATNLLTDLGLGDRLDHKPNELSGGQQQRVAIARALVNKPKILFADEPTANLDSTSAIQILELFQELNKKYGQTIVMVTHEDFHKKYVDRVIYLKDGQVVKGKKND